MKLKSRMAIHCDTQEKAKAFIKECYNQGFTWWGNKNTNEDTFWEYYKEYTVYYLNNNCITYSDVYYFHEENNKNFKLYEYDDLFRGDTTHENLRNLVDTLYKNLQYRMCLNGGCPYESLCDGMLDELNISICDVLSDMINVNRQHDKKKESKMINIGQSGSAFTLGQYNKEVK